MSTLYVISGPPGSGKSSVGAKLAPALGVPLISKDEIKEALFETVGWADRERSKELGAVSWELMFAALPSLLAAGGVAVDANVSAPGHDRVRVLSSDVVEFRCTAPDDVIIKRFRRRWESGNRHRGHADNEFDIGSDLRNYPPLEFARTIEVDTNSDVDIGALVADFTAHSPAEIDLEAVARDLEALEVSGWSPICISTGFDVVSRALSRASWKPKGKP